MQEDLIKLGFEGHQSEIYLALVDLGQCGAGDLVKKTGIHRNIVYETLDRLITKRLVVKVLQKSLFQYRITDPAKILEDQKINLDIAESIIPEIQKRSENKSDFLVWDGIEGFRNFRLTCMESIKPKGTIYVLGAIGGDRWGEIMGSKYNTVERIRLKKEVEYRMITYKRDDFDAKMMKKHLHYNVRMIENSFQPLANVMIWEDNIALQSYTEPISVMQIKNKNMAEAYLNYFEIMWKIGKNIV
jgi:sugar-specific transcriptional regulator TrmB